MTYRLGANRPCQLGEDGAEQKENKNTCGSSEGLLEQAKGGVFVGDLEESSVSVTQR